MTEISQDLPQILADHLKWVNNEEGGKCANLRGADLRDANLCGADLRGADLRDANLCGADLRGAKWNDEIVLEKNPLCIQGLDYDVIILDHHMKIGCEFHSLKEWSEFDDERIAKMDGTTAHRFWKAFKEPLLSMAKADGRE